MFETVSRAYLLLNVHTFLTVQVLSREVDVNSWEIVYAISWRKDYLSVCIIHNYNYTVCG